MGIFEAARPALIACLLFACGGGDGDDTLTALEGVYTVDTWTRNATACDVEGRSTKANHDPNVFIKSEAFFGTKFVNVNVCPSVGQCQADARDDMTLHIGQWGFQRGNDDDGWVDATAFAFALEGVCQATRNDTKLTSIGDTVHVEQRTRLGTFEPDATGNCADADAVAATVDVPCANLEVMAATFTAAF